MTDLAHLEPESTQEPHAAPLEEVRIKTPELFRTASSSTDGSEESEVQTGTTDYEQSAAAALLGLHTSLGWGSMRCSPESPHDSDPEPMGGWGERERGSGYSSPPEGSMEVSKMPRLRYGKDGRLHPPRDECARALVKCFLVSHEQRSTLDMVGCRSSLSNRAPALGEHG